MQLSEKVIKALTGCKITSIQDNELHLDNGQPIYLDDSEVEALNSFWEPFKEIEEKVS